MLTKQMIVIRNDLNMRKGKMVSQGAHASLGALLKCFRKYSTSDKTTVYQTEFSEDSYLNDWLNNAFTKICVYVNSETELMDVYNSIPDEIPKVLIIDNGKTEFNGVPTATCIGVGPWESKEIDLYTSHLKLL